MFKNYLFVAVRNIIKHKGYSIINIAGLAIGLAIFSLTAARMLNWDNPIGKKLTIRGRTGGVIGVVKDFHFKNLIEEIYPTVLFLESNYLNYLYIKLTNAPVSRVLNFVENQRRTKEIGIRKVHGATMTIITRLILTDFLKLIVFAMIITWPLFYFVDRILVPDIFAYSAETGFAFYIYAGALALITGFAAVLFQTIKAGRANPIEALRYE